MNSEQYTRAKLTDKVFKYAGFGIYCICLICAGYFAG